ncbi:MAG: hypothetical protein CM1200mP29_16370 [Verrucomicrobiota bacterium]|nr:MAG: hypothetical protein CM1200mP29_16370 [Verrucomicrobiota bacterium]
MWGLNRRECFPTKVTLGKVQPLGNHLRANRMSIFRCENPRMRRKSSLRFSVPESIRLTLAVGKTFGPSAASTLSVPRPANRIAALPRALFGTFGWCGLGWPKCGTSVVARAMVGEDKAQFGHFGNVAAVRALQRRRPTAPVEEEHHLLVLLEGPFRKRLMQLRRKKS